MKYFIHDTSAFQDEKITQLFMGFGFEGLGLFFTILEKLAFQEKPVNTTVLKKQLFVGKKLEKCWRFMESIDLISSNNGETFNKQLLNFSGTFQIKKEKTREKVSQWRKKQEDTKNVTGYVPSCNPPKVKESKVNINKEEVEEKTHPPEIVTETLIPEKKVIKSKSQKEKKVFIPPSCEDVTKYFEENGFSKSRGEKAFNFYNVANWEDSKGSKVLNWKQKMIANWFDPENTKSFSHPATLFRQKEKTYDSRF